MTAFLSKPGVISALGEGLDATRATLFASQPGGIEVTDFFHFDTPLALGRVKREVPIPGGVHPALRSRNNGLLALALEQIRPEVDAAIARFGAHRVGIVLGTSTSGIAEAEAAARTRLTTGDVPPGYHYSQQELGSSARYLATVLQTSGPSIVISTACSSSAKAMISAARWLEAGLVDAVITGGADSLCSFTIAGFRALDSVSVERCNPMSRNRHGINIGEAATLFVMTREGGPVRLAGWGETSDAHHISAPDPTGAGAIDAMRRALARAGLTPNDVGYVNMHGTATPQNDAMESRAVEAVVGLDVPVSSTKALTGHTLGAAGALEAAISYLTLVDESGRLPPHWFDGERDPDLPPVRLVRPGEHAVVNAVLSNSFAFGGSNAVLALCRS